MYICYICNTVTQEISEYDLKERIDWCPYCGTIQIGDKIVIPAVSYHRDNLKSKELRRFVVVEQFS